MPNKMSLVTIKVFYSLPEAGLAKSNLESNNIPCFLKDENLTQLIPISEIKLMVSEIDKEKALEILNLDER